MNTYSAWLAKALLGLVGLGVAGLGHAACTLDAPTVILPPYNALGTAPAPVNVSFVVSCTTNAVVQIQASAGNSGNQLSRQLRKGSAPIAYNLYVGSTATTVWGNGAANTGVASGRVVANGTSQIVGNLRVPGGQNPEPGVYTDVLMFTMIY